MRLVIARLGAIPKLIALIEAGSQDVQRRVLEALLVLGSDYDNRKAIGDAGGIEPILDLLRSDYTQIQTLALQTLAVVCEYSLNRKTLRKCLCIL